MQLLSLPPQLSKNHLILLAVITLLPIFFTPDYGISWDEPIQNDLGNASWNYLLHGSTDLFHLQNQYHGAFVEMVENIPSQLFQWKDAATVFLSRHLINFLIFWLGAIFLFLIGKEIFRNDGYAMLAVLILFLTPRILAQSFYNSKDLPLLSFFIIANYLLLRFIKRPAFMSAVLFALVSGMVFSIRVLGILIPVFAVAFFVLNILNGNLSKGSFKYLLFYVMLTAVCCILFSPVLWHDPLGGLQQSFSIFSHYPYDDPQFFQGKLLKPQELPWYYIPVWMGITIPVLWQLFFVIGLFFILSITTGNIKSLFKGSWPWLLIAAWCFVPWLMILLLHSAVYDEWRHLFFIYPAFILIAVLGIARLHSLLSNRFFRIQSLRKVSLMNGLTSTAIVIQAIVVMQFIITNHPYENVYFNFLAGKKPQEKFDLDYWGLSYRQGLDYLVQHAKEDTIRVCWQNAPGNYNLAWLNQKDRSRIRETSIDSSMYFLTNFRFHPEQYNDSAWHTIRVNNFTILAIEKLR